MDNLISPYGGELKCLLAGPARIVAIKQEAMQLPSLDLSW